MKDESNNVEGFFNKIAGSYKEKYSGKDKFLNYFFNERLIEATRGLDFKNKTVLDIGAGTGNLYDELISIEPTVEYYATDIAAEMLRNSLIPLERQFVGEFGIVKLPVEKFDFIFLLGVTTYLSEEQLGKILFTAHKAMNRDARLIITFTNRSSLDWKSRKLFKKIPKRLLPKQYVLSQDFPIYPRDLKEIRNEIHGLFKIDEVRWLNHTIFPFNQILKGPSMKIAKGFHRKIRSKTLSQSLSSDILTILERI